jgi:hypothetical protein
LEQSLAISPASESEIQKLLAASDWQTVLQIQESVLKKSDAGQYGYDARQFAMTITRVIDSIRQVIIPEIDRTSRLFEKAASDARQAFFICISSVLALLCSPS